MNWINKYNDFRVECIIALKKALKKGYNQEELWNSEQDEKYELPTASYIGKYMDYETYSLVSWDKESFKGVGWESGDEFWFEIDDIDLLNLCKILDYINEQN